MRNPLPVFQAKERRIQTARGMRPSICAEVCNYRRRSRRTTEMVFEKGGKLMYDELVKRLRYKDSAFDYDGRPDIACDYEQAADAIGERCQQVDKLAAEAARLYAKQPRWIPVTEALPECDFGAEVGNVEWISCGMVHAGCFGRGGKYRDAYFRTWTDAGEGMDAKDADCWRAVTLPEPPKKE